MRRERTIFVCERCGMQREAPASKFGPIRKSAPYPKDWKKIWKKIRVCPSCGADWEDAWNKYLAGGVVSSHTKVLQAQH